MQGIEAAFVGTVGSVPELKTSGAGKPWAAFSVAVSNKDEEEPTWVRVAMFGDTATKLCGHLMKGDKVYAEGNLKLSRWTDQATGEDRTGLQIAAWKVTKLGAIGRRKLKNQRADTRDHESDESALSA